MSSSARFPLHRAELYQPLVEGERKIAQLLARSPVVLKAEDILIRAGEDHPYVYRMRAGWACRTRTLEDGRHQIILIFLPGDLFAVKSLFLEHHTDDIRMLTDATVERVHHRDLHRLYHSDPDVTVRCTWQVIEEERRLHNWIVNLGQAGAEERLAAVVLDFQERLVASGVIPAHATTFELPLTQTHLAAFLGITPVHMNRVLRAMREAEIFEVRGGVATIHSMEKLVERAIPYFDHYERSVRADEIFCQQHPQITVPDHVASTAISSAAATGFVKR